LLFNVFQKLVNAYEKLLLLFNTFESLIYLDIMCCTWNMHQCFNASKYLAKNYFWYFFLIPSLVGAPRRRVDTPCSLKLGVDGSLSFTTRCAGAHTFITRSIDKLRKEKIEVSRRFQTKSLMEDDSIYLGELALDLLVHREHSLSSPQNISSHLGFPWPIKEIFLDHMKGGQEEHPYIVGLKSGIEENLTECC